MSAGDRQLCGDNAAPYVLGALEEHEQEEFRRHLQSCAVCREEVAALQVVTGALSAAVEPHSASAELKQRMMASVREDSRGATVDEAGRKRARRSWAPAFTWSLAVPGALVLVAIVVAVIALSSGSSGSSATHVYRATAPTGADVSLRVSDGRGQLEISGMPQTPPRQIYEVWIKRGSALVPTDALFTVTSKGDATVGVPGSLRGAAAVLVTSEPLGGTKVPTTTPVIVASLS
jgi:anti-sigma-K factor RskA